MKKIFLVVMLLLIIIVAVLLSIRTVSNSYQKDTGAVRAVSYKTATVFIGQTTLNAEIADTLEKQELGLGGRSALINNTAMLFVFPSPSRYKFWMKDMRFAIDIIWLSSEKRVVFIKDNVSPDTFPEIFTPPAPALYVLETAAGFVEENGVKIGDMAVF